MVPPLRLLAALPLLGLAHFATAQCDYVPATDTSDPLVTYTYGGGSISSFGCAPIDPTYWMSGNSMYIIATYAMPADHPIIRVWGMNDNDIASVEVDGAAYPLNDASATIGDRVICGEAPGPGVHFAEGNLTGPVEGNYSYEDITLNVDGVTSIRVNTLAGLGWGFVGVGVTCVAGLHDAGAAGLRIHPNPVTDRLYIQGALPRDASITLSDATGRILLRTDASARTIDLSGRAPGLYTVTLDQGAHRWVQRVMKP
ncbi:MAG: T9SS type A sorting domain-containing protein [Bacteroidetes bacterium]|nr:T9SS type A sorting domain-containing protein [Bacteroidota bacterium]